MLQIWKKLQNARLLCFSPLCCNSPKKRNNKRRRLGIIWFWRRLQQTRLGHSSPVRWWPTKWNSRRGCRITLHLRAIPWIICIQSAFLQIPTDSYRHCWENQLAVRVPLRMSWTIRGCRDKMLRMYNAWFVCGNLMLFHCYINWVSDDLKLDGFDCSKF